MVCSPKIRCRSLSGASRASSSDLGTFVKPLAVGQCSAETGGQISAEFSGQYAAEFTGQFEAEMGVQFWRKIHLHQPKTAHTRAVAALSVDLDVLHERVREIRMNTIKFLEQYLKHFSGANLPLEWEGPLPPLE